MGLRRRRKSVYRNHDAQQLEERCLLSTITVNSLADNVEADGSVTLREAIEAANTDSSVDGSTAGNGSDKIVFAPSLAGGTIALQLGQIRIDESLTIEGRDVEIDAQSGSRIFKISNEAAEVQLKRLNFRNGFHATAGGAIQSSSPALVLFKSTFTNNVVRGDSNRLVGGAIYASQVVLNTTTFEGNSVEFSGNGEATKAVSGGAVHAGQAEVKDSTFTENSSDGAGGAMTLTDAGIHLTDSVLIGNSAPVAGGGLFIQQTGDGPPDMGPYHLVTDTTIQGNVGTGVTVDAINYVAFRDLQVLENSSHGIEVINLGRPDWMSVGTSQLSRNGGSGLAYAVEEFVRAEVYGTSIEEKRWPRNRRGRLSSCLSLIQPGRQPKERHSGKVPGS